MARSDVEPSASHDGTRHLSLERQLSLCCVAVYLRQSLSLLRCRGRSAVAAAKRCLSCCACKQTGACSDAILDSLNL